MQHKIEPKISEKSVALAAEKNVYTFAINGKLATVTASTVKSFVEKEYSVKVSGVNMLNRIGKEKRAGKMRKTYRQAPKKIAYVTLVAGDQIPVFNISEEEKGS